MILPPVCYFCDQLLPGNRRIICEDCWRSMEPAGAQFISQMVDRVPERAFGRLFSIFRFTDTFQQLIHLLKYERHTTLAVYFARQAATAFPSLQSSGYHLIVPVPLHPTRYREREYNQSMLFANALAAKLHISASDRILARTRSTVSQTTLNRRERIANVSAAFSVTESPAGKNILLVDDIFTTGSTVNACAIALNAAGCSRVDVLTMGIADDPTGKDNSDLDYERQQEES
jgi:ComF family protein